MSNLIDLVGKTYGRLTVKSYYGRKNKNNYHYWICDCSCGTVGHAVAQSNLKTGAVRSCGCIVREQKTNLRHGMKWTKEYHTWTHIKDRCHNTKCKAYYKYGAKGVKVCDRWLNSFSNFFEDMGYAPSPKHSIERNDVTGNYSPENCRWATPEEQANNKRNTILIEYRGEKKPLRYWSRELGFQYDLVRGRMWSGQSFEHAISYPADPKGGQFKKGHGKKEN